MAITLAYNPMINENTLRKKIFTHDQRLVSSIRLEFGREQDNVSNIVLTLNDRQQVDRLTNTNERKTQWKLHGIPISNGNSFLREYVLFVFQTEVLMIYRSKKPNAWLAEKSKQSRIAYERIATKSKEREVRKVQNWAIRALYALGLDYGMIKCGIVQGKQIVVVHINPNPRVSVEMQRVFLSAIQRYVQEISKGKTPRNQVMLGADPEFVVTSPKGGLVVASKYLPYHGRVGCDAIWIGRNRANKPLVEVRPEPSVDPRQLVIRIYENLLYVEKKMNTISGKWLAGALPYEGFPIGGHIHFSGVKPNFKMLRALDNYMALLLVLVEDQRGVKRRPKYGFLGDYRFKDYGGFEYRTLPSWLISPTLTKGVLALSKCIVANYRSLSYDPLADPEMQKAYYLGKKEPIRAWIDFLWSDLRRLSDYQPYASYLDGLYQYLITGRAWDEKKDFRRVWRLPPYHKRK